METFFATVSCLQPGKFFKTLQNKITGKFYFIVVQIDLFLTIIGATS